MNQQQSQQNYQQYAPRYPGQSPSQYNQQMQQQYPQQQYQVAPHQSQYVPQAPSQQAMIPGIGPDGLYRGQRPPNPCICCKFCCGGTCSLRTGCFVIGSLLVLAALLSGASGEGTNSMMSDGDKSTRRALVYVDSIFNLLPGILLLVGAGCLETTCCTVAAVLLVLGGVFGLIALGFVAFIILNNPDFNQDTKVVAAACFLIISAIIGFFLRSYYAYCAWALAKQIRNGEYSLVPLQPNVVVTQTVTTAPSATYNAQPNGSPMPVQNSYNQEQKSA